MSSERTGEPITTGDDLSDWYRQRCQLGARPLGATEYEMEQYERTAQRLDDDAALIAELMNVARRGGPSNYHRFLSDAALRSYERLKP